MHDPRFKQTGPDQPWRHREHCWEERRIIMTFLETTDALRLASVHFGEQGVAFSIAFFTPMLLCSQMYTVVAMSETSSFLFGGILKMCVGTIDGLLIEIHETVFSKRRLENNNEQNILLAMQATLTSRTEKVHLMSYANCQAIWTREMQTLGWILCQGKWKALAASWVRLATTNLQPVVQRDIFTFSKTVEPRNRIYNSPSPCSFKKPKQQDILCSSPSFFQQNKLKVAQLQAENAELDRGLKRKWNS